MSIRNIQNVSKTIYGRGSFLQLDDILLPRRNDGIIIFVVDDVHENKDLASNIPAKKEDKVFFINVDKEPTTKLIDLYVEKIKELEQSIGAIVAIGGGSIIDTGKAISLMLNNTGKTHEYQGWDLVKKEGVYKIGIPTISGTGAEISRTCVLTGPEKKLGLNSDYTVLDQIVLDPDLLKGVPKSQWFYTGMDCYIHCVESIMGTNINEFANSFAQKSLGLCQQVFLQEPENPDELLMMASYMGGMSITYSAVGACHALSYGLSYVLGYHHGIGNCIAFNVLDEYYGEYVQEFRTMLKKHNIDLPQNISKDLDEQDLDKMAKISIGLGPLWENVYGKDWEQKISLDKIKNLYRRM